MSKYQCDNCEFEDEEDNLPFAENLSMRLTAGGKYTDRECPKCGALCFPVCEQDHVSDDVTDAMVTAGRKIANELIEANTVKVCGGLGGSKTLEEYLAEPKENVDLLEAYATNKIASVEAIYVAMRRASGTTPDMPQTSARLSAVGLVGLIHAYSTVGFNEVHAFTDTDMEYVLLVNKTNMHTVRIYANGQVWKKTAGAYVRVAELS